MARPIKTRLDYFPLDCVLDREVEMLETAYGNDGFAVLIKAWQECYRTPDGRLDIINPLGRALLARHANVTVERWETIVATAVEIGLFDRTEYEKGILTSNGVRKRIERIEQERSGARSRARKNVPSDEPGSAPQNSGETSDEPVLPESSSAKNPRKTPEEFPNNGSSSPKNPRTTGEIEREKEREIEKKKESVCGKHTAREEPHEPTQTSHPPPLAERVVQLPTGEAYIATDRILDSAMTLHEFPEEWRSVLMLWIEIHDNAFPRPYDVNRLRQLLDLHPIEAVEDAICAMGDAGKRAIKHLMEALNGTASPQVITGPSGPDHPSDGAGGTQPGPTDPRVIGGLKLLGITPINGHATARSA